MSYAAPFLLLLSLWAVVPAQASNDHDRARAALQSGQVLPLRALLEKLETTHPGQVLEVELEQDHGAWIYEVKLLQAGGRLNKLKVDATTGLVLEQRTRNKRH